MNYRHGFHAGNFADVLKHAVLARMLAHLLAKDRPFRVIDTHAGRGAYDLGSEAASRTGEWRHGIARITSLPGGPVPPPLEPALANFLRPYLDAVEAWRAAHGPLAYPGSPAIIRHALRRDDRLIAVEANDHEFGRLARLFPAGSRAKALKLDGYEAWNAFLPPKERRGLVVVDPPYEATDEFARVAEGLAMAARKWPTGMMLIWYPAKDHALTARFVEAIAKLAVPDMWHVELDIGDAGDGALHACGLVLVNPPWTLPDELSAMLSMLVQRMARGRGAAGRCERLT